MEDSKGFVKLYRQLINWEWYDDIPTKVLFIHLLLTVNYKEGKWHGQTIKRGSRITSVATLSEETRLTTRQTRTALQHLEATNEVTIRTTRRYSYITVNNYDKFQQATNKTTNSRQTNDKQNDKLNDKQATTIKEYNTTYYKEEKKRRSNSAETFSEANSSPSPSAASAASEGGEDGFKKQELKRFNEMGYDF